MSVLFPSNDSYKKTFCDHLHVYIFSIVRCQAPVRRYDLHVDWPVKNHFLKLIYVFFVFIVLYQLKTR